jgi:hypothetical protein
LSSGLIGGTEGRILPGFRFADRAPFSPVRGFRDLLDACSGLAEALARQVAARLAGRIAFELEPARFADRGKFQRYRRLV